MVKLEGIFRIGLAHPVMHPDGENMPAVFTFPKTSTVVQIEPPPISGRSEDLAFGAFHEMVVHVERVCPDELVTDTNVAESRSLMAQDAARAFAQLFETIRDVDFRHNNTVAGYPVVRSEQLQTNPLVRTCEVEWVSQGTSSGRYSLTGIATIGIGRGLWAEAVNRIGAGESIPIYRSFALDAFYFAQHDPVRGIIMACAAWEIALRSYLTSNNRQMTKERNLPALRKAAETARGGPLFFDYLAVADNFQQKALEHYRDQLDQLPKLRNKLLHQGEHTFQERAALEGTMAVLGGIDWLYEKR